MNKSSMKLAIHITRAFATSNHADHVKPLSSVGRSGTCSARTGAGGAARSSSSGVTGGEDFSSVYTLTSLGGCYGRVNLVHKKAQTCPSCSNCGIFNLHRQTHARRSEH